MKKNLRRNSLFPEMTKANQRNVEKVNKRKRLTEVNELADRKNYSEKIFEVTMAYLVFVPIIFMIQQEETQKDLLEKNSIIIINLSHRKQTKGTEVQVNINILIICIAYGDTTYETLQVLITIVIKEKLFFNPC